LLKKSEIQLTLKTTNQNKMDCKNHANFHIFRHLFPLL